MPEIDSAANHKWTDLDAAWYSYQAYLSSKRDRLELTYLDLLYIRNFKAGNASILVKEQEANDCLRPYSEELRTIRSEFGARSLVQLHIEELARLKQVGQSFLELTHLQPIKGFGVSYASALLSALFPTLFPIMDRRALSGAGIVDRLPKSGQVVRISQYYGELIDYYYRCLRSGGESSLREVDKKLFGRKIKKTT